MTTTHADKSWTNEEQLLQKIPSSDTQPEHKTYLRCQIIEIKLSSWYAPFLASKYHTDEKSKCQCRGKGTPFVLVTASSRNQSPVYFVCLCSLKLMNHMNRLIMGSKLLSPYIKRTNWHRQAEEKCQKRAQVNKPCLVYHLHTSSRSLHEMLVILPASESWRKNLLKHPTPVLLSGMCRVRATFFYWLNEWYVCQIISNKLTEIVALPEKYPAIHPNHLPTLMQSKYITFYGERNAFEHNPAWDLAAAKFNRQKLFSYIEV